MNRLEKRVLLLTAIVNLAVAILQLVKELI